MRGSPAVVAEEVVGGAVLDARLAADAAATTPVRRQQEPDATFIKALEERSISSAAKSGRRCLSISSRPAGAIVIIADDDDVEDVAQDIAAQKRISAADGLVPMAPTGGCSVPCM